MCREGEVQVDPYSCLFHFPSFGTFSKWLYF